jgi:hypothetical protein
MTADAEGVLFRYSLLTVKLTATLCRERPLLAQVDTIKGEATEN